LIKLEKNPPPNQLEDTFGSAAFEDLLVEPPL
jgi:hypothetical protein